MTRAIAGAALGLSLLIGGWTASDLTLATGAQVEAVMSKQVDPKTAQRKALAREASYEQSEAFYETRVEVAMAIYGDEAPATPSLEDLRQPNTFYQPITPGSPRSLGAGESLREGPLAMSVQVEELIADQRGIRSKTKHTLAKVRNQGSVPVAYFLDLRKEGGGECRVRALTRFDAMVLEPGEQAEISICSGEHRVEVTDLRILELTAPGAIWIDKIPPQAVGLSTTVTRAHEPGRNIVMCTELPVADYAKRIAEGTLRWEDLIDFYSRHDCEQFRPPTDYRRAVEPLASLPVVPKPD